MGRREDALRILKDLQHTTDASGFSRELAAVWTALGNKDEAFRLLSKLLEQRSELIIFIKVDLVRQSAFGPALEGIAPAHEFPGGIVCAAEQRKLNWQIDVNAPKSYSSTRPRVDHSLCHRHCLALHHCTTLCS